MTGHHSWEKLMRERHTPEERARIRADALKMLAEDDDEEERGRVPRAGRAAGAAGSVKNEPADQARPR